MSAAVNDGAPRALDALDPLPVDALCLFVSRGRAAARRGRGLRGLATVRRALARAGRRVLQGRARGVAAPALERTHRRRPASSWFWGWARVARRSIRARSGTALSQAADVLNRAKVDSVALELPGRGAMPARERTSGASTRQFAPAFRGARVTLLATDRCGPPGELLREPAPARLAAPAGQWGTRFSSSRTRPRRASSSPRRSTQIEGVEVGLRRQRLRRAQAPAPAPLRPDHHRHQHAGHQRARAHQLREEEPELP